MLRELVDNLLSIVSLSLYEAVHLVTRPLYAAAQGLDTISFVAHPRPFRPYGDDPHGEAVNARINRVYPIEEFFLREWKGGDFPARYMALSFGVDVSYVKEMLFIARSKNCYGHNPCRDYYDYFLKGAFIHELGCGSVWPPRFQRPFLETRSFNRSLRDRLVD